MKFILTKSGHSAPANLPDTETDESEMESEVQNSLEFVKTKIEALISDHGGEVLHSFPGPKQQIPKQLFVISDRACKTMTYLLGITYNYPPVNFQWVVDSVSSKQLKSYSHYTLPVGVSKVVGEVEFKDRAVQTGLFAGKTLLVTAKEMEQVEDWKQLLTRLGASACARTKGRLEARMKKVEAVVCTTGDYPESVVEDAKKKGIPVVGTSWIIESIITGSVACMDTFIITDDK